jgi:Tfp pilus assembly protein PilF
MRYLATLFFAVLVAGCAGVPAAPPPSRLFSDSSFSPPSGRVGAVDLFAISPAMRAYLDNPAFRQHLRTKGPGRGLVDALYQPGELKLDYSATPTGNAAATFLARRGNCLSLVIMTAAFAKALGLDVQFQKVVVDETWSRMGGLYVASAHVNLRIGPRLENRAAYVAGDHMLTIDFLPPKDMAAYSAYPMEESALVALYMNNRAIETMVEGRLDDAYWWARGALMLDPGALVAYNTLAVIYQRHGDGDMAERTFRVAMEREPQNVAVMRNLAQLLATLGKTEESQALERRVAAIDPEPPFHFFNLGKAAMEREDYRAAKALFAREVKRAPYNDEFHFWLGLAHLRLGESAKAREQIALAHDTSTTSDGRSLYSAKLAHLQAQSSRPAPAF